MTTENTISDRVYAFQESQMYVSLDHSDGSAQNPKKHITMIRTISSSCHYVIAQVICSVYCCRRRWSAQHQVRKQLTSVSISTCLI